MHQRPTISPYRHLLGAMVGAWPDVKDRLRWDLNALSRPSRQKLLAWRDRFGAADRAVVLCNGPSLNRVDFDAIAQAGAFTFGLNKINLLFARSSFRPSCIVAVNGHVIEQNAAFYDDTGIPLFLDSAAHTRVRHRDNAVVREERVAVAHGDSSRSWSNSARPGIYPQ